MLQPNYDSKQVSGTYNFMCIAHKIKIICGYVDPNLYYYCKGHLWSWCAEAQHLKTNAPEYYWFVLRLGSEAGRKMEK